MSQSHAIEIAQEEQELDLTPLIDCFLMLIIFFSCLEFRSLEAKMPAYLPKSVGRGATPMPPEEVVTLKILGKSWGTEVPRHQARPLAGAPLPIRLVGHQVSWQIGARGFDSLSDVEPELRRILRDRAVVPGAQPLPLVLEPQAGTTFSDVTATLDAALAAGFGEVRFGGGTGHRAR